MILVDLLQRDLGVDDLALSWFKSYLSRRKQHVVIDQQQSRDFDLATSVPQGSCLGPILFVIYASLLFHVTRKKHLPTMHGYSDDTQLYESFCASQDATYYSRNEDCICDIGPWMIHHQLMLNDGKTEFLIVGSRKQRTKVNIDHIHEGTSEIKPADSVRNLGTWFDSMMSMAAHVGKVCSKAFFGLYKIRQIRKFLSEDSTKILIHVFVTSNIDYCNSLPFGIPQYQIDRLQNVLNAAARLVCHIPRYAHITPTFGSLHWLPIEYRIRFKVALLVFKSIKGMDPKYLKNQISIFKTFYPLWRDALTLQQARTRCKTFGDHAFVSADPKVWNALPPKIRSCETIDTFKRELKALLYREAFC